MLYAVVDIETTGSHAEANGITEIAIVTTDGANILDRYETLINPRQPIPQFIQSLTGITNRMVAKAPAFETVAPRIFELLHDKIFVAHNVQFDYSFVQYQLLQNGFGLHAKKLCTIRLGRKVFPGLKGYGLSKLTHHLGVQMEQHHRAGADAKATAEILHRIIAEDREGHVPAMLKGRTIEQQLPPHLSAEVIDKLPATPGVYYFHDGRGKVVYVGKARNLRKRVTSHFTGNDASAKRQSFVQHIHHITYQVCGSELMAFILEHTEIRRLWPAFNNAHKRFARVYGLYSFEDNKGFLRLAIEQKRLHLTPLYTFNLLLEGQTLLRKLIAEFDLCAKMCFLDRTTGASLPEERNESIDQYNERVLAAMHFLRQQLPTFAILEQAQMPEQQTAANAACILMEGGRFYGMGYLPQGAAVEDVAMLKNYLTPYQDHDYVRGLIYEYVQKWPAKRVDFGKTGTTA